MRLPLTAQKKAARFGNPNLIPMGMPKRISIIGIMDIKKVAISGGSSVRNLICSSYQEFVAVFYETVKRLSFARGLYTNVMQ